MHPRIRSAISKKKFLILLRMLITISSHTIINIDMITPSLHNNKYQEYEVERGRSKVEKSWK